MIDRNISIHLQDFPDVNFIKEDPNLVENIDLVRDVCSTALSIRDQKNLRVRLPLNKLTVIGQNAAKILDFGDIIKDEVNVKNIDTKQDFSDLAELKLQLNFKKIGKKYGSKIKELTTAAKSGNFTQISPTKIKIADIFLENDDFELKLAPKNPEKGTEIAALPDNSCLIVLDSNITAELAQEGIARDLIRAIQQARKDADLNVSDRISLQINAQNPEILTAAKTFQNYIKEQVLATDLTLETEEAPEKPQKFTTKTKIEDGEIAIFIN